MEEAHIIFHQGKGDEKEILNLVSNYCEPLKLRTKGNDVLVFFNTNQNAEKVHKSLLKTKDLKWTLNVVKGVFQVKYPIKPELLIILNQMQKEVSSNIDVDLLLGKNELILRGEEKLVRNSVEYLNSLFVDDWVNLSQTSDLKKIVKKPLELELSEKWLNVAKEILTQLKDERCHFSFSGTIAKIYFTTYHYEEFKQLMKNKMKKVEVDNSEVPVINSEELVIRYGAGFFKQFAILSSKYKSLQFFFSTKKNDLHIKIKGEKKIREVISEKLKAIKLENTIIGPFDDMKIVEEKWETLLNLLNELFIIYKEKNSIILVGCEDLTTIKGKIEKELLSKTNIIKVKPEMIKVGNISYDKNRKLGEGNLSQVFYGYFNKDIPVAVKRLQKFESGKFLFSNEIENLKKLTLETHENIINYRTHEEDDNFYYIVLDYCPYTLSKIDIKLNFEQKKNILNQMAKGLNSLHQKRIIHRDIKPDNILLTKDLIVKISDFGLSKICINSNTFFSNSGSLEWKGPECFDKNAKKSQKSDVFSLGCVFHQFITGKHPFDGNNKSIEHNIITGSSFISKDNLLFYDLIENMITADPLKRFSMDQVLDHYFFKDSLTILSKIDSLSQFLNGNLDLKKYYNKMNKIENWIDTIEPKVKKFMRENYKPKSSDLLRLFRNLYHHLGDSGCEETKTFFSQLDKSSNDYKNGLIIYFLKKYPEHFLRAINYIQKNNL